MPPFSAGLLGHHSPGHHQLLKLLLFILTAQPSSILVSALTLSSQTSSPSSQPTVSFSNISHNHTAQFLAESIANKVEPTVISRPNSAVLVSALTVIPPAAPSTSPSSPAASSAPTTTPAAVPAASVATQQTALNAAGAADVQHQLNLQFFGEALGGVVAPAIMMSDVKDKPFQVENETFVSSFLVAKKTSSLSLQ
jgi:hypothetical protein